MFRKPIAEFTGTFWLVFGGCGSAIFTAVFPLYGIGSAGVALAFGLTVVTMGYAVGYISGGHFNPAVTLGLWAAGRFPARKIVSYITSQVMGGVAAALCLFIIIRGQSGFELAYSSFAANGYGAHSPGYYDAFSAGLTEIILTFFFVLIVCMVTDNPGLSRFTPLATGLTLTLIHLISIPVTNTSVNPARSTAVALIKGGWALEQLWFFWCMPVAGGILGGMAGRGLLKKGKRPANNRVSGL
ncbi:MAG: aquaporin Z [Pantoea sp.]|uniref:aquaporin Z n=1 Tax=Pantoea sp. TaxID=69393 RepID=UPI0039E68021